MEITGSRTDSSLGDLSGKLTDILVHSTVGVIHIAVIAYEPKLVTVFISAWIPAPPEESEPAIINIFVFILNLFNFF